jgi:pantoate kinase
MGPLINFLVLMVLLFAGLAQTNSIPRGVGYGIAGALAVITFILAIIRYNQRKDRGE